MKISFETFLDTGSAFRAGLPAAVYTDPEFHKIENRTVFQRNWVFAGFAHEQERPGDLKPVTIAGQPVLLIRDKSGDICAYHNACRHRGLKLVETSANHGKLIRCPYHSWAYGLDGKLKAAPYFCGKDPIPPETFPAGNLGLVPIRCETWHDWIFVNLDGQAPPLKEHVAPLKRQLGTLPLGDLKPIATLEFGTVRTNWKALMENFIEPYHVQFVHRTTTQQPLITHSTVLDQHCLGSKCDIDEGAAESDRNTLAVSSRFLTLFPNFVLGTYAPNQVGVHLNTPAGADETLQRRVIYVHRDQSVTEQEIEQISKLWYEVHKEDHQICERLQLGRLSESMAQGGLLSPHWEDSVRRFQELLVESVSPAAK